MYKLYTCTHLYSDLLSFFLIFYILFLVHLFLQSVFKAPSPQKITSLALGGQSITQKDRIFVSTGSEVRGFTKKGKNFLNFNTNMSEAIQTM